MVSTLFLEIKAGFANVNATKLWSLHLSRNIPFYIVDWVSFCLTGRTCTLVYQGASNTPAPASVRTPQGSPLFPQLFLLYIGPLHCRIPTGVMIPCVDDFSRPVVSPSHSPNIR